MKNLKTITLMAAFIISSNFAMAQDEETYSPRPNTKWIPVKGYWVIESNIKTPKTSVVHFYNNDQQLLSSVNVVGKRLNPQRRKTLKNLKKVLDQVVDAWATKTAVQQQEQWVAILTGKR